jgi:hypothetical protein
VTLQRRTPLAPGKPLAKVSASRLAAAGGWVWSTFPPPATPPPPRPRYTGPTEAVLTLLRGRCGGRCEYPGCPQPAQDPHHRDERGVGGRGRKAPPWINEASNLLAACRWHNNWASNGSPAAAYEVGWRVRSGQIPMLTPVLTRHYYRPILLNDRGTWTLPEPGTSP